MADPVERLRVLGRVYCEFALDNPQQYRTMMMDVISGAAYEKTLPEMRAELGFDVLFETVTEGIATGQFADIDPLQASFYFWCVVHGVVSLFIAKNGIDWGDRSTLIDGAIHQAIEGIRPTPVAPPPRRPATKAATTSKPKPKPKPKRPVSTR